MWAPSVILQLQVLAGLVCGAALPDLETQAVGGAPSYVSPVIGYPNGQSFTDKLPSTNRRLKKMIIGPCGEGQHLSYLSMTFVDGTGESKTVSHGILPAGASSRYLDLTQPQYHIDKIQLTTWRPAGKHTRIGWMMVVSNGGLMSCGTKTASDQVHEFSSAGSALHYFTGTSGEAINSLQGFFQKTT